MYLSGVVSRFVDVATKVNKTVHLSIVTFEKLTYNHTLGHLNT